MPVPDRRWRELPPTAGLPLGWRDIAAGFSAGREGEFGKAAAAFIGAQELLVTASGTAALVIALTTLARSSSRHKVIIPAYSCPLVVIAIKACGLTPILCDLRPDSLDLDTGALETLCDGNTLAVIPTHLAGRVSDLEPALRIARAANAAVIEDAAQAFGARTRQGPAGLSGDIGFFSLAVGKGLTLFEGGLLHARDAGLRKELGRTAAYLCRSSLQFEWRRSLQLAAYALFYRPSLLPLAYGAPLRRLLRRGDTVGAAGDSFGSHIPLHSVGFWRQGVGCHALQRLPAFQQASTRRAEGRLACLQAIPGIKVFTDKTGDKGIWPSFLIRLPDANRRDRALARLWPAGLGVAPLFVHALPDYGYLDLPQSPGRPVNAAALAATTLSLGNSAWLTPADLDQVCAILEEAAA